MKTLIRFGILFFSIGLILLMGCQRQKAVAMVTFDGTFSDGAFNELCKSGLDKLGGQAKLTYLDGFAQDEEVDVNELLSLKADLIYVIHQDEGYAASKGAEANPTQTYIALDQQFANPPENLAGTEIRGEEGGFLAGYAAASMSKTGKIGFLGGLDTKTIQAFSSGYRAGAAYAEQQGKQKVTVEVTYLDNFSDQEAGRQAAKELYAGGCDVIFQAAGGAGLGAIAQAKEEGKWIIGVDEDQHALAPGQVIASVVKHSDVMIQDLTQRFLAGQAIGGQNYGYGLQEEAIGLSTTGGLLPQEIQEEIQQLEQQIKTGEVKVS